MSAKTGKECTIVYDGSDIDTVIEASLPVSAPAAEAGTRGDHWMTNLIGLLRSEPTFTLLLDEDDAAYTALAAACVCRTVIALQILSGPSDTAGSEGLSADFFVTGFNRGEPLEEGVTVEVTLAIAKTSNAPEWVTIGS